MKIAIASVERKTSKKTGRAYLSVKDKFNNVYSLWDNALFDLAQPGQTLEADISEKNGFKNINSLAPIAQNGTKRNDVITKEQSDTITWLALIKAGSELVGRLRHGTNGNAQEAGIEVIELVKAWKSVIKFKEPEPEPEPEPENKALY